METSAFVALLTSIVVGRILNERAYRTLSDDEKLRLMDGFSHSRAYSLIPLVLLIGAYYYVVTSTNWDHSLVTAGYFALLVVYLVVRTVQNQHKLHVLALPARYQQLFLLSQSIGLAGAAWFVYAVVRPR